MRVYFLYLIAKRVERIRKGLLALFLIATAVIDIVITYHVYMEYPVVFFKHEANLLFLRITYMFGINIAIFVVTLIDMLYLIILYILPYRAIRTFVFHKATLHLLGLNWILIIQFNVFIIFISLINFICSSFVTAILLVSFITDEELFSDLYKLAKKFRKMNSNKRN